MAALITGKYKVRGVYLSGYALVKENLTQCYKLDLFPYRSAQAKMFEFLMIMNVILIVVYFLEGQSLDRQDLPFGSLFTWRSSTVGSLIEWLFYNSLAILMFVGSDYIDNFKTYLTNRIIWKIAWIIFIGYGGTISFMILKKRVSWFKE